jgi:AcrR family transcriptional regulator
MVTGAKTESTRRVSKPRSAARKARPRTGGRSARVVAEVLSATLEMFAELGYAGVSVEGVAARASVNKTTIYRRWPTKLDLVTAVIANESWPPEDIDTGALESDIRAVLCEFRDRLYTVRERGVLHVLLGERAHPEVAQLVRATRERHIAVRRRIFERAIARGELAASCDPTLLVELMTAPLVSRIMHLGQDVDDAYIDLFTAILCNGVKALR